MESVDLTQGTPPHTVSDALLAAVVTKAAGRMLNLRLTLYDKDGLAAVWFAAVLAAVKANALRRLDIRSTPLRTAGYGDYDFKFLTKDKVDELLHAAPAFRFFCTNLSCSFPDAHTLLAGQGQNSVVHIRRLDMSDGSVERLRCLQKAFVLTPCKN